MDLLRPPETATVAELRPFLLHATPMVDVALRFDDGHVESHRLGAESVAEGLAVGDAVTVERMMAMVVGVRRAG
ncbi:MAG: hypothetical protein ACRDU8_02465 [Egibacteraceae bacterium]